MVEDSGVHELLQQWAAERSDDAEMQEVNRIKDASLKKGEPVPAAPSGPTQEELLTQIRDLLKARA